VAPSCTTHFSIVDRHGNMCSVTQTLLSIFGSRVVSPSTGLLLNNGIMWFDPEPGKPNSLGPGKRCLGNFCPVIGEAADGRRFALGASGGRKIIGAVGISGDHPENDEACAVYGITQVGLEADPGAVQPLDRAAHKETN